MQGSGVKGECQINSLEVRLEQLARDSPLTWASLEPPLDRHLLLPAVPVARQVPQPPVGRGSVARPGRLGKASPPTSGRLAAQGRASGDRLAPPRQARLGPPLKHSLEPRKDSPRSSQDKGSQVKGLQVKDLEVKDLEVKDLQDKDSQVKDSQDRLSPGRSTQGKPSLGSMQATSS